MGFGSTAKKLQRVTDLAEEVYERLSTLHDQVTSLRDTVEETNDRVAALEDEVAAQRAVVEALAREEGIDPDDVHEGAASNSEDDADATGDSP